VFAAMTIRLHHLVLFALLAASSVHAEPKLRPVSSPPSAVRKRFELPPFYTRHLSTGGIPIISSDKVPNLALREAAYLVDRMLSGRNDIRLALVVARARVAVIGVTERTTQLPDYADLEPPKYWDRRARGFGPTTDNPLSSCGEENLLRYKGDPHIGQCLLIHEFAHLIHIVGMKSVDKTFDTRLETAWNNALKAGLYKGTYAHTNPKEYWAEGAVTWFHAHAKHGFVAARTRADIRKYDPALAKLLHEVFGNGAWRYVQPMKRKPLRHFKGYKADNAPVFAWSKELEEWFKNYERLRKSGEGLDELKLLSAAKLVGMASTSRFGSAKARILFMNATGAPIKLVWVGGSGERHPYGVIPARDSNDQVTSIGDVWLVTSVSGKVLGGFKVTKKRARARLK
jgi:hypothetical protein